MNKMKKIKDNTEKMWFLGTDILEDKDLIMMENSLFASFSRDEGAIYHVENTLKALLSDQVIGNIRYSETFSDLFKEAKKRKYEWIFFDRDIQTDIE